ncbi:hypothetical protein J6590_088715 [Homalodisca vitripennis]|nr:hypothetical protein J6590_088715 [Homalodisca vitripennis]
MFCKLYDVEGELILINGSGWSAGIILPHLMLVSNPTPQPLLPLYWPSPPQTMKRCGRFGQCVNVQTDGRIAVGAWFTQPPPSKVRQAKSSIRRTEVGKRIG